MIQSHESLVINCLLTFRAHYSKYCSENYGNGHCDEGCNTAGCGYDGLDCNQRQADKSLPGTLVSIFNYLCVTELRDYSSIFLQIDSI